MNKVSLFLTHFSGLLAITFTIGLVSINQTFAQVSNPQDILTNKGKQIKPIETIAFGSCNNQRKKQVMWQFITAHQPDIWIWLGDIIYCDTDDMAKKKTEYDKVKYHPEYRKLTKNATIIGIWDDHDYAKNDMGKEFKPKSESCKLLLDFLDVPETDPVWSRPGAYNSYCFNEREQEVKVILLDNRYFRDELKKKGRVCYPNPDGDVLGEAQWAWLEKELSESTAKVNIIGSGFQVLPEEHQFEKWANFPKARQRLIDLLEKYNLPNVFLISGDRHVAECSRIKLDNGSMVHEITSSGLTHTWPDLHDEPNKYRFGKFINKRNFAVMNFDWNSEPPTIEIKINGLGNKNHQTIKIELK